MGNDSRNFDEKRFHSLLDEGNFLGAWCLLKAGSLDRTEESIMAGILVNRLAAGISAARHDDDREKQALLRSLLAYVLKDWPGLASLYREQIRAPLPGFVPENLQDVWQDFTDVMSGRKGLDESFRQKMDETRGKAREYGFDLDPLQGFVRDAEKELRKGVNELGDFLKTVFSAPPSPSGEAGKTDETAGAQKDGSNQSAPKDEPTIKVKIQDADDPLPKDIHQAPPADK